MTRSNSLALGFVLASTITLLCLTSPSTSEARTQLSIASFKDKIQKSECVSHDAWEGELSADLQKSFIAALVRRGRFNVVREEGNSNEVHYKVQGTITRLEVCDIGNETPLSNPIVESAKPDLKSKRAELDAPASTPSSVAALSPAPSPTSSPMLSASGTPKSMVEASDDIYTTDGSVNEGVVENESDSSVVSEVRVAAGSKIASVEVTIEVVDAETGKVAARTKAKGEAKLLERAKIDSRGEAEVAADAAERALEEAAKEIARAIPDRGGESMPFPTVERSGIRQDDISAIRRHTGPSKGEIALAQAAISTGPTSPGLDTKTKNTLSSVRSEGATRSIASESQRKTLCLSDVKSKKKEYFACTVLRPINETVNETLNKRTSKGNSGSSKFAVIEGHHPMLKVRSKTTKHSEKIVSASKIYYIIPVPTSLDGPNLAISCREAGAVCVSSQQSSKQSSKNSSKAKRSPAESNLNLSDRYQACVISKKNKKQGKTQNKTALKLDCSGRQLTVKAANVYRLFPFQQRSVSSR